MICRECGNEFSSEKKRKYCNECLPLVQSKNSRKRLGDKALPKPFLEMTLGEVWDARPASHLVKSIFTTHARKTYKNSGKPQKCAICGYKSHIDIAHIRPLASFNMDAPTAEINHPDNLVALCKLHHKEFDEGLLDLSEKSKKKAAMEMIKRGVRMLEELDGIRGF
jgi:hypothetical protein